MGERERERNKIERELEETANVHREGCKAMTDKYERQRKAWREAKRCRLHELHQQWVQNLEEQDWSYRTSWGQWVSASASSNKIDEEEDKTTSMKKRREEKRRYMQDDNSLSPETAKNGSVLLASSSGS